MALGSSLKEKNTKPVNQYPLPLEEKILVGKEFTKRRKGFQAGTLGIQTEHLIQQVFSLAEMVAKKLLVKPVHKIGKKTLEFLSKT